MEQVSARTVLTAANGGDIIVGRESLRSGGLTQEPGLSQTRVLEILPNHLLHRHHFSTCISSLGGAPVRQLYQYKPFRSQPQFLQFTYLSICSVNFLYFLCISTAYREEWNIYCYVDCIALLWWLPEDGTSVSKHMAVYICYIWCITQYIWWMIRILTLL